MKKPKKRAKASKREKDRRKQEEIEAAKNYIEKRKSAEFLFEEAKAAICDRWRVDEVEPKFSYDDVRRIVMEYIDSVE